MSDLIDFDYYEGVMDCADGHPAAQGRTETYYAGYGDEYQHNIDTPETL